MTEPMNGHFRSGREPPKLARKSRPVLCDVPLNLRLDDTSGLNDVNNGKVCELALLRRSGRLSNAVEAETTKTTSGVQRPSFHDKAKLPRKKRTTKRGRRKSAGGGSKTNQAVVRAPTKRLRSFDDGPNRSLLFDDTPPSTVGVRRGLFEIAPFKPEGRRPQEHHNLVLENFDSTKYTTGLSGYDLANHDDVLHAPEYVSDIFQRLYQSELCNSPHLYMHNQNDISVIMRAILVDWLVGVHLKFRFEPETLHLAVNIMDRYLTTVDVSRTMLQLVGATAFLVAAKYEEIYPPELQDIVVIMDRAYSKEDVLDMESDILTELSFNLTVSTGYPFLQRFLFITQATLTMGNAAKYYMERMLQEHDSLEFRPSIIAAAAVCLAINHPEIRDFDEIEAKKPGVPRELMDYSGYSSVTIYKTAEFVARKVAETVVTKRELELISVKRKYAGQLYEAISTDFEPPDAIDILDD